MNRFNLDPVFTFSVSPSDDNTISNVISMAVEDKIEKEIYSMLEYKDAKNILSKFTLSKS
jgi:hypothetical protein